DSPATTGGCDRGGIDDVAFDPFLLQGTMYPEAVQPRFLHDYDRERFPSPCQSLLLESRKPRQKPTNIPGRNTMVRHFLASARRQRGDQPACATELHPNENCTKITTDSARRFGSIGYNLHARLQSGSFATALCQSAGRYPPPIGS